MVRRIGLAIISLGLLSGCITRMATLPTNDTPIPTNTMMIRTSTASPTLPPTLTPVSTQTDNNITLDTLPMSQADQLVYDQALLDIERYRMGDITIQLFDTDDNPLAGYLVEINQSERDFWFGTATAPYNLSFVTDIDLNAVTLLPQWWLVEPQDGVYSLYFANFWMGIEEASSAGLRIKTNGMFTPGDEPDYMNELAFESYLDHLYNHVATLVEEFAPHIDQWEAILEPNFGNHNPYRWTHDQYFEAIATSISAIRAEDPSATIEINLSYPCGGISWLNNFQIVEEMIERDIDFDVLGLQLYYNAYIQNPPPAYIMPSMSIAEMAACVDRYAELLVPSGRSIAGSEICVPADAPPGIPGYRGYAWSETLQAQYLVALYTVLFSKPLNSSITWWDFDSSGEAGFVHEGGLIDSERNPRLSYYALQDLIGTWTSEGTGVTATDGSFTFRGFAGEYEIILIDPSTGSRMSSRAHINEQESATIEIVFAPQIYPDDQLLDLEHLTAYWAARGEESMAQFGRDMLALYEYHLLHESRPLEAQRVLTAGLNNLTMPVRISLSFTKLRLASFNRSTSIYDGYSQIIWSSDTLYYQYDFPRGRVHISVRASASMSGGEWPDMVIGVGGNFSDIFTVDQNHPTIYTFDTELTGDETLLTIRFPWEENSEPGEFKLFIYDVEMIIFPYEMFSP